MLDERQQSLAFAESQGYVIRPFKKAKHTHPPLLLLQHRRLPVGRLEVCLCNTQYTKPEEED